MSRGSFEYYVLDINTEDLNVLEEELNKLGDKGWQLKSTIDEGNTFIFERQKLDLKPYTGRLKNQPEPVSDQPRPNHVPNH